MTWEEPRNEYNTFVVQCVQRGLKPNSIYEFKIPQNEMERLEMELAQERRDFFDTSKYKI